MRRYSVDVIERLRDAYVTSNMTLQELLDKSVEVSGQQVANMEDMHWMAREGQWSIARSLHQATIELPSSLEEQASLLADLIFQRIVTGFDEMSDRDLASNINSWTTLRKTGAKGTGSAKSDLQKTIDEITRESQDNDG